MRIQKPKDVLTGILFLFFGGAAMVLSFGLTIGTAAKMGPGYFPFALGALLAGLGGALLVQGVLPATAPQDWPALQLKPVAIVLLSVVLFSQLLKPLGLVLSTAILVLLSSRASHEFRWRDALINAAVLVAIVIAVFVYLLEFQIPVWPKLTGGAS